MDMVATSRQAEGVTEEGQVKSKWLLYTVKIQKFIWTQQI
jgi:hypothetical protein